MKAVKYLICSLIIVFLISCKDKKEADQPLIENVFTITINAKVSKDDTFQVFYNESNDAQTPFEEKYSIFTAVKGSDQDQDIVFKLPEDVFPTQIRLDFGINKSQTEISISNFKINYKQKSFEAKGSNFFNYFTPDTVFVKVDKVNSKAIPFVNKDGGYDPMFISKNELNQEILKLIK